MRRPDKFIRDEAEDIAETFVGWCDAEYGGVGAWIVGVLLILAAFAALCLAVSGVAR